MGKRGKRKYICEDCKVESWHHWIELNRAARMRCPACGSTRLEPLTASGKDAAALAQTASVFGAPSTARQRQPAPDEARSRKASRKHGRQKKIAAEPASSFSTAIVWHDPTHGKSQIISVREAAKYITSLYGKRIDEWHICRLLGDDDDIPDPKDAFGNRIIASDSLPRIIELLQSQGWLPKPSQK